jgi:hypothetical protein
MFSNYRVPCTNLQKYQENKSGIMTKPNILVRNRRNESSDNISNTSNTSSMVGRGVPKPTIPLSNKSSKPSFLNSGPFKHLDTSNENEPLIKSSSRRRAEDYPENYSQQTENLNCINLAVDRDGLIEHNPNNLKNNLQFEQASQVQKLGNLEEKPKLVTNKDTPNFRIEDQEDPQQEVRQRSVLYLELLIVQYH